MGAGAFEVVNLAAKELDIDEVHATKILVRDGIYSDELITNFNKPLGKRKFIENVLQSKKYDMASSIAFGDSPHDIGMLERVKFPIVLNPSKRMLALTENKGWLVLNRRNVVEGVTKILEGEIT